MSVVFSDWQRWSLTIANNLQPYYNGGIIAQLFNYNPSELYLIVQNSTYWLSWIFCIQKTNYYNRSDVEYATGFKHLFLGTVVWSIFVLLLIMIIVILCIGRRCWPSKCRVLINQFVRHFKKHTSMQEFIFKMLHRKSCHASANDVVRYKLEKCSVQVLVTSGILFLLCIITLTALFSYVRAGFSVDHCLFLKKSSEDAKDQDVAQSIKISAGHVQHFVTNELMKLNGSVLAALETTTVEFELIITHHMKLFVTLLLDKYGIKSYFESVRSLFKDLDNVLSAMKSIKRFQTDVLKDLNFFDGSLSTMTNIMIGCCGQTNFCKALSQISQGQICLKIMQQLANFTVGINSQNLNLESGSILLTMLEEFQINVPEMDQAFKISENQLDQLLQQAYAEVKQIFNVDSLAEHVLALVSKVLIIGVEVNSTLDSLKTTGADQILCMLKDYWYTIFVTLLSFHCFAVAFLVICVMHTILSPAVNSLIKIFFEKTIVKFNSSGHGKELKIATLSEWTNDISIGEQARCTFQGGSHIRNSSYCMAVRQKRPKIPSHNNRHVDVMKETAQQQCLKFPNKSPCRRRCCINSVLVCCGIFSVVPWMFGAANFYLGAAFHTQICRYLHTEEGVIQSDRLLDQYMTRYLTNFLNNVTSQADLMPITLNVPHGVLRALNMGCGVDNATLLSEIGLSDIVNVNKLMQSSQFQQILDVGRVIARKKISDIPINKLIPVNAKEMLDNARSIASKFIDNIDYKTSIMELQKPLILIEDVDFHEYVQQLLNVSRWIQLENTSSVKEAILLEFAAQQLSGDNSSVANFYLVLTAELIKLQTHFMTLQNTRLIAPKIDTLQSTLNNVQDVLNNAPKLVNIFNLLYDEVIMQNATESISLGLQQQMFNLQHKIGFCKPINVAYKVLSRSLCDFAVPSFIDFGFLNMLLTISSQMLMVSVWLLF